MSFFSRHKEILLVLMIIAVGAFFRFYKITSLPPGLYPDEAMNGNNALEALHTGDFKVFYPENNGREGLFINLQAVSVWLFGNEAWALRLVSALFGTLTILGMYFLTKELFFDHREPQIQNSPPKADPPLAEKIKIQNDNLKSKIEFYNTPRSGFTKILHFAFCILHWCQEIKNISYNQGIALLSSFFLATSYWHINFSRIGFRAIMVPFFLTFGFFYLLRALRTPKIHWVVLAGVFTGLGFHTYIAFRLVPLILLFVLGWKWREWRKETQNSKLKTQNYNSKLKTKETCLLCVIALFLFVTFVTALPVGWYFLNHPADFSGRQTQVSIFSAANPLKEFAWSNLKLLGMFNVRGDCNQRHNFRCQPELYWPVGIFFLVGLIFSVRQVFKNQKLLARRLVRQSFLVRRSFNKGGSVGGSLGEGGEIGNYEDKFPYLFLLILFLVMSLPATLTKEGIPHALRSIGLIVPVFIFAGLGTVVLFECLRRFDLLWGGRTSKYLRIFFLVFFLVIFSAAVSAFTVYFLLFASDKGTPPAFSADLEHIGEYVNSLPKEIPKYIMVNMNGVEVKDIPMPAQTVMFLTDSFRPEEQKEKNIYYFKRDSWGEFFSRQQLSAGQRFYLIAFNSLEKGLIPQITVAFPGISFKVMEDFVVFYK